MKSSRLHHVKGYTMIELMVTLAVFAIVTLFAVPAFFTFIEKSRAKAQIAQAANFMRSAQEIAISSNRTVYVFTEGLLTYHDDILQAVLSSNLPGENTNDADERRKKGAQKVREYWTQNWIMAFKPMGDTYKDMYAQLEELTANQNRDYIIASQRIFTPSEKYVLSIIDSAYHNGVQLNNIRNSSVKGFIEMEGYSKVRETHYQGSATTNPVPATNPVGRGAPTFIAFYPSGEVSLPIFIISERTTARDQTQFDQFNPSPYDFTFSIEPKNTADLANHWDAATVQSNFKNPIAILAGCRTGRSLTVDSINYTFKTEMIQSEYIFDGNTYNIKDHFKNTLAKNGYYTPPPSFGHYLCGSKFLR